MTEMLLERSICNQEVAGSIPVVSNLKPVSTKTYDRQSDLQVTRRSPDWASAKTSVQGRNFRRVSRLRLVGNHPVTRRSCDREI
jgi:hypothetical protein